ncbi:unnamed protein product [Chironomus riparius]|uniref:Uncharacterized protein n=1 Tax=Chironomus riparius TaxID=315576 RepID=A0A9N9WT25_9DIPT|nr:unnamed protein product [Chironomus riparius]
MARLNVVYFLWIFCVTALFQIRCEAAPKAFYTEHDSKLPKFICNAVIDIVKKDHQVNTVSMAIFKHNFELSIIDKTLKCIQKRLSVNVKDFRIEQHKLEVYDSKASIVIMIADRIDMLRFSKILSNQQSSLILNHMAKFFIITSTRNSQVGQVASTFFPKVGIINFSLAYEKDEDVFVEVSNHFTNSTDVINATSLATSKKNLWKCISSKIFPDKLKNLNSYTYLIADHQVKSHLNLTKYSNQIVRKNKYFFESVAKHQSANVQYVIVNTTGEYPIENKFKKTVQTQ